MMVSPCRTYHAGVRPLLNARRRGVREVVVILAYVHPDAAQRLALAFYDHWLLGKGSAEALRQAQLEVRRERPDPLRLGDTHPDRLADRGRPSPGTESPRTS
jgi:CHAT domain-containing protein